MTEKTTKAPRSYQGVMISSTFTDLEHHRQALIRAVKTQGLTDVAMENDSAKPDLDVLDSSLQMVRDSSAYVGVISRKYGQIPKDPARNPENLSLTELEFDEAQRLNRPIVLFIMGEKHPVTEADVELNEEKRTKLSAFRERAKKMGPGSSVHRVYATFDSLEEFKDHLGASVASLKRHIEGQLGRARDEGSPVDPPVPSPIPIPTPPTFYAEPPYLASHSFVGRRAELDTLSDWALPTEPHPILLFEAIGGTGKSMLTWEWVTNHALRVRTDWAGRFWYSFYEKGAQLADFCRYALAYITAEPLEIFKKMKMLELGERLAHHLQRDSWLLVLDGLERILVAYHRIDADQLADEEAGTTDEIGKRDPCSAIRPEDDDLLRVLATCKPSKLLVTSRLLPRVLVNYSGQALPDNVLRVPLRGLRPPDAEALFRACGVKGGSEAIQGYLQKHCDCHPLVIGVLAGLVNEFMPDRSNFDAWEGSAAGSGQLDLADIALVQKRNHILAAALSTLPKPSHELLSILALLSEAVDYETLSALNSHLPPSGLASAITDLGRRGLVQYDAQDRRYDLHPVVRSVVAGGLRSEETEHYGWRVVDHFSQMAHVPYDEVEAIEDLRPSLQVVRTLLWMGRLEDAYNSYHGALANALGFNLEAHAELLALLKPFFPKGWASPPEGLGLRAASYVAVWAAFALQNFGSFPEALAAYGLSLKTGLVEADWWHLSSELWNISNLFYNRNRLAISERCETQALDLASLVKDPEALFMARLNLFRTLGERGEGAEAERLWMLLDPMGRAWARSSYRPGEAERQLAVSKFWQGTLCDDDLERAEWLTREGKNRNGLRGLHCLRGEWRLEQGGWQGAAESFQEALRMAHEVLQDDAKSETLLALAKLHLGQIAEPRLEVERLSQAKNYFYRGLAELWLAIDDKVRAKECALAAYKWSWADGEPYVHRYELNKSRELLERLGVEIPNLLPYDPAKDEKLPWEDEVAAAIEQLRAEKAAAGQPRVEG